MATTAAVRETYGAATDDRTLATQASDTEAEAKIKAGLVAPPVRGSGGIDVYCRQGVVVLVGVVPAWASDLEIKEKIRATLIADSTVISGRVDVAVIRRSCRAGRSGVLAADGRSVCQRRARGEWRRRGDVLHPDDVMRFLL